MAEEGKSWWGKFGPFGRGDLATQVAVLSAWTMGARGQSVEPATQTAVAVQPADPQPTLAKPDAAAQASGAPAVNGLKIASPSWRRSGLGSNALFNFTLRNT